MLIYSQSGNGIVKPADQRIRLINRKRAVNVAENAVELFSANEAVFGKVQDVVSCALGISVILKWPKVR